MPVILTDEPDVQLSACCLCGAGPDDGHWSICPYGTGTADTDPDADCSEQQCEIL